MLLMKAVTVFALVLLLMAGTHSYSQEKTANGSHWYYPDDTKAICKQWPQNPYRALGLPEGTVSVLTDYCEPGFMVRRPTIGGFWRIEHVMKLYYKGKLFAVSGSGRCFSEDKHELGCEELFVVYDPDGNGRLDDIGNVYNKTGQMEFHTPEWVLR